MKKIYVMLAMGIFNTIGFAQIPTAGLSSYWPFDGNANDYSGNGNHGAVNGATPTSDRFGNPNKAYSFDGMSNYIDVPHSQTIDVLDNQDFTIAFWIKTNQENDNSVPLSKHIYGTWNGYLFMAESNNQGYCNSPGQLSFYTAAGAQEDACADSPICNDHSNWYFVTGIRNALIDQTYLYVNGVMQSDIGAKSGGTSNTENLTFGAVYSGIDYLNFFNGYLDGVRIYNRVLTEPEIIELYNEPNPTTGINEVNSVFENMNVFPDPSNGSDVKINFGSKVQGKGTLSVIDNLGKVIIETSKEIEIGENEIKLNLENVANGFYYLTISNGSNSQNMKFIKN